MISGSMTVFAGPDQVTMGPGDYYVVPTNVPHMVRFGPEGTRALVFSSPAGFADLVARAGTPATWPHTRPSSTRTCSWP